MDELIEQDKPQANESLTTASVGRIALDHSAANIESAFGLFEPEQQAVKSFIAHIRQNDSIKTRSEVIERLWNHDKLALYQRIWAIYQYGYNKGQEDKAKV